MSRVILFNMITVDGFFAGPGGNIDWHNTDEEFNQFSTEQLHSMGGLIFGRVTYQLMADYWPTTEAIRADPQVAELMNSLPKVVFSRTLSQAAWSNTRLVSGDAAGEVFRLKQQPGPDLFIFGSANLAASLTAARLIDEYRLMVNPLVLGGGIPLFASAPQPFPLKLIDTRPFRNGNVLLTYTSVTYTPVTYTPDGPEG